MSDRRILIFTYDGTADGFYSAVFDAFVLKTLPIDILPEGEEIPYLLDVHRVETNLEHAKRVRAGIANKISRRTLEMVEKAFLFDGKNKEMSIMVYLWDAFRAGGHNRGSAIDEEKLNHVFEMCISVNNEAEHLRQFTRFKDVNGALVAEIHPKHFILPLIRRYFCARIKNEHFMVYDAEHGAALIHAQGKTAIIPVESLELPGDCEDEFYSELWKNYYKHIAIAGRYNPTCRRNHMPKRFWQYLPEVQEELEHGYAQKLSFGTAKEIGDSLRNEHAVLKQ